MLNITCSKAPFFRFLNRCFFNTSKSYKNTSNLCPTSRKAITNNFIIRSNIIYRQINFYSVNRSIQLLTSGEFTSRKRNFTCNELKNLKEGTNVKLCGWVSSLRFLGQNLAFLLLRDSYSSVQTVFEFDNTEDNICLETLKKTTLESVVYIEGTIRKRPLDQVNKNMDTGDIEVVVTGFEVLNKANNVPIPYHRNDLNVNNENTLLKYRYLELRQPYLQHNIRTRSEILRIVRNYFTELNFCEIETPTLFRKTSEGAREYIVPTRTPNKFYTLTQSPQQYKQLLMASGFDKYYQIARCYRDEDLRSDRQPEFTQIDLEMAFVQQDDVMEVIENLLAKIWKEILNVELVTPFPRRTFQWCMENYGSDKPDTRYDMKIHNVSEIFRSTSSKILNDAYQRGDKIYSINLNQLGNFKDKDIFHHLTFGNEPQDLNLIFIPVINGKWKTPLSKHISQEEKDKLTAALNIKDGDMIVLGLGSGLSILETLGKVRTSAAQYQINNNLLNIPENSYDYFWVVDFPLFTIEDGILTSTHHPFTAPTSEDAHLLSKDPLKVRGQHYDVVINGYEIGGGSIRIHKKNEQLRVLKDILKLSDQKVAEFNHLLDALDHGCPPHGGIALGLDRLVSVITNSKSLRDCIAFPKSSNGSEIMTGSPSEISKDDLRELLNVIQKSYETL